MKSSSGISTADVLAIIRGLSTYPYAEICRHHVGAVLLSKLEEANPSIGENPDFIELCAAVCSNSAGDGLAVKIIDRIIGGDVT